MHDDIEIFCQIGKSLSTKKILMNVLGDQHMPLVILMNSYGRPCLSVLEENTVFGTGPDRLVKIKNPDKNEPTFEVKLDMTPNFHGYRLATTACIYIKFN